MMKTIYKVRVSVIFLLFMIASALIIANLFMIQIRLHTFYTHLATQQYQLSIDSLSPRASILDRTGKPLAQNQQVYSAFILPRDIKDPEQLQSFLQKHYPQAYQRLQTHPNAQFLYIKRKLSAQDVSLFKKHQLDDIKFLREPHRYYPLGETAAPLVGITNIDNHGIMGLELIYESTLSGKPTTYYLQKDARSQQFYFEQKQTDAGTEGTEIHTTLDSDIQFLTYHAVKKSVENYNARQGAAVVMNPDTGEVIALVSYPSFDPHNTRNLDIATTKNIPVTNAYELGSVMKIFVALGALHDTIVTPTELIDCKDRKTALVNGISINTWKAHGILPFNEVIQKSNNIGIATVAYQMGPQLYDHYINLGFGSKTGIDIPGEQSGFVNHPSRWSKRSFASLSFGYESSASLIQLARAVSVISNGGYLVQPHINAALTEQLTPVRTPYSYEDLATIKDILIKTVSEGTGHRARIQNYTVLGKTGTANLLIDGAYDSNHNRFTFAGAIEKGSYKRVIVAFVEDADQTDLYASQVTTPLFRQIAECIIIHDKVM